MLTDTYTIQLKRLNMNMSNTTEYVDWYDETYETNVELFIEQQQDEFNEFCQKRYEDAGADAAEFKRELARESQ